MNEYHKQSFCKQTDEEILQLASLDNMVTRVKNEQLSVEKIHEEEQLRLGALGIEAEKISRIVPQYQTIKSRECYTN